MPWKERKDIRAYLLFEAIVFVAIKIAEFTLTRNETRFIMYSAIVGNTVMALRLFTRYDKTAADKHSRLIFAALMVTCVADLFLTLVGGNAVCAWLTRRREGAFPALLFAVGLTGFLLCDVSVALEIMLPAGTLAQRIFALAVRTFYVPAQVLLVLTYSERLLPSKTAA